MVKYSVGYAYVRIAHDETMICGGCEARGCQPLTGWEPWDSCTITGTSDLPLPLTFRRGASVTRCCRSTSASVPVPARSGHAGVDRWRRSVQGPLSFPGTRGRGPADRTAYPGLVSWLIGRWLGAELTAAEGGRSVRSGPGGDHSIWSSVSSRRLPGTKVIEVL